MSICAYMSRARLMIHYWRKIAYTNLKCRYNESSTQNDNNNNNEHKIHLTFLNFNWLSFGYNCVYFSQHHVMNSVLWEKKSYFDCYIQEILWIQTNHLSSAHISQREDMIKRRRLEFQVITFQARATYCIGSDQHSFASHNVYRYSTEFLDKIKALLSYHFSTEIALKYC